MKKIISIAAFTGRPWFGRLVLGLALVFMLSYQLRQQPEASWSRPLVDRTAAFAAELPLKTTPQPRDFASMLAQSPVEALQFALDHHRATVTDYTCTFIKQEQLGRRISPEQVIEVSHRREPYSVFMHWIKNQDKAERVIYVKDRWLDEDAESPETAQLAVCQPGAIARLLVKSLKMPIRGAMAREAARRPIDSFGFERALELMVQVNTLALQRGELDLKFEGASDINGRPTWVIHRNLPWTGEDSDYPDASAIVHIDQEWLIPLAIYSFADREATKLLGRYEYHNVELNAGVSKSVFEPVTYGM